MVTEPLCGRAWLNKHLRDHTLEEIEALTITVIKEGSKLTIPNRREARGVVSDMVKTKGKGG